MRCSCNCGNGCVLALIGGLIAGIVLTFFAAVELPVTLYWIAFGVSLLFLVLTLLSLLTVDCKDEALRNCICSSVPCLLAGIFLTLISSVVVLILSTTASLAIFFVSWFFFFMIIAMLVFLACIVGRLCN